MVAQNTYKPLLDKLGFDRSTTDQSIKPIQRIMGKRFFNLLYKRGLPSEIDILFTSDGHGTPSPSDPAIFRQTLRDHPTVSTVALRGSSKDQYTEYFRNNPYLDQINFLKIGGDSSVIREEHTRELLDINGFKNVELIQFDHTASLQTILDFIKSPYFPKLGKVVIDEGRFSYKDFAALNAALDKKRAAILSRPKDTRVAAM